MTNPSTRAEANAPQRMAICCREGVAPTRYPVFRSWEVLPPFEMATQTTAATLKAAILYGGVTQPSAKKINEVMSSVATVMPEMGFDELPTSPVRRELTVTKRNPSTRISSAPSTLSLNEGTSAQTITIKSEPIATTGRGMSRSVRSVPAGPVAPLSERMPRIAPPTMVGRALKREMMPPAATAPAPIYRIYDRQTSSVLMSLMSLAAGEMGEEALRPKRLRAGISTRLERQPPAPMLIP